MKSFTLVCVLALAAFASARPGEKYTDHYDNINVDEILSNRRLLMPYLDCLLEKKNARCTAEGKELKSHIQEALETYCEKCTEIQRTKTRQVIAHLIHNENEAWVKLSEKYDPTHKYTKKYEDELRAVSA